MESIVLLAQNSQVIEYALPYISSKVQLQGFSVADDTEEQLYLAFDRLHHIQKSFQNEHLQETDIRTLAKELLKELLNCSNLVPTIQEYIVEILNIIDQNILNCEQDNIPYHNISGLLPNKIEFILNEIMAHMSNNNTILSKKIKYISKQYLENGNGNYYILLDNSNWNINASDKIFSLEEYKLYFWKISPERYYLLKNFENRDDKANIEVMTLGMSYIQRGLNIERLNLNTCCLAAPSQDIFYDYQMCLYAYDKLKNLKYCLLAISPYELWYDMSLSQQNKFRSLQYIPQTHSYHHLENGEEYLKRYFVLKQLYEKIFQQDIVYDQFYQLKVMSHWYETENLEVYPLSAQYNSNEDSSKIQKFFQKNYQDTFLENIQLLKRIHSFLKKKGLRTYIIIPPFPQVFIKNMNYQMYERTIKEVSTIFGEKNILNFIGDKRFTDYFFSNCDHLNYFGASLMADIINSILQKTQ